MTDYRAYAAEYDDSHDRIDDEQEVLKGMFARLRADVRKEFPEKADAQAKLAEFKALLVARRKFGPMLEGYADKSERIQILNDEIFGRSTAPGPNKRTTANPSPNVGPSIVPLARARDKIKSAPVIPTSRTPDRQADAEAESHEARPEASSPLRDGASATIIGSLETAASETAARSPNLSKGEGLTTNATMSAPSGGSPGGFGATAAALLDPVKLIADALDPTDQLDIRNFPSLYRGAL